MATRRVRSRLVIQLGIFIIILLLIGPYIFHLKLNEDVGDDAEGYRRWQLRQKEHNQLKPEMRFIADESYEPKYVESQLEEAPAAEEVEEAILKFGEIGNFEPSEREVPSRPGENGEAVHLQGTEKMQADITINEFGFNMVASDKVAMDRIIPDTRHKECPFWHYPEKQPSASVILVFHNEGFSTLVRTIHSVVNQSPPELLKEVVLVDDFSNKRHLKTELEEYVKKHFGDLVKLYRNSEREGLIRTRSRGAELATGDVIVFLDAHCECNRNWLVPLLDEIRKDRTTMAVPIVDGIDFNTMAYTPVYGADSNFRGIFEWGFFYKEKLVPQRELAKRKHSSEPYRSPTHAGGLFAMDRKYFYELGGYDPGLKIWGGENYELSFKIWQCGGSVKWVPCSRVGHIYRNHMPYGFGKDNNPFMSPIHVNYMRVVEVWMEDEFKEYFYTREPSFRGYPIGNITKQIQFKKDHNCKSFRWFMENVAYDVYDEYPKPPPNKAWGEVRKRGTDLCWEAGSGQPGHTVGTMSCHGAGHGQVRKRGTDLCWEAGSGQPGHTVGTMSCHGAGHGQLFRLNVQGQIGTGERCIDSQGAGALRVIVCTQKPTGPWVWDKSTGMIRHIELNKCVNVGTDNQLHLKSCNPKLLSMKWDFKEVFPWKRS
ncbi:polypeptide n-acetylgalactosaminyltransferase [Plakobranchus ocellatus]|uniref:Polypeptide N-acetylgalactosaminyltransferase n=1 Tax=Plakobranchus ocellatus TaxID=259542 RepID=A0AAV4ALT3_9GAST|nr:polypeptide n-acetylgalactosaminyltransferase [Plakobranchus ocellatus]